jgi:hypothetical protein
MASKKKSIWLTYDFGLKGNYAALFTFLDNHKAIECGNGTAYFIYKNENNLNSEELINQLKNELQEIVNPSSSDRIYAIWRNDDTTNATVKGRFLFGGRRNTAPWNGYSTVLSNIQEEEAI